MGIVEAGNFIQFIMNLFRNQDTFEDLESIEKEEHADRAEVIRGNCWPKASRNEN